MGTSSCGCKDIAIIEGVFGEIHPEGKCYTGEEAYNQESSTIIDGSGDRIIDEQVIVVKSYTLINSNRMEVVIITWGATIVSLKCPDKFGHAADVVLGFDNLPSYMDPILNPYIGCILGRYANRIKNGCVTIKGKYYQLPKNDMNKHHLHGGANGFGRQIWDSYIDGCSVVMTYLSKDNEEGYPGALLTSVRFKLTPDNKLEIYVRAATTKTTIVNISHGSLFNLAGHDAGERELKKHKVSLNCDRWTFADYTNPVPTGAIRGVWGTVMDLRIPRVLGEYMAKVPPGEGYDHNFCVTRNWQSGSSFVARALHMKSGRVLEVYSDQPGVQFYTGGRLPPQPIPDVPDSSIIKKLNHKNIPDEEIDNENMEEYQSSTSTEEEPKQLEYILGKEKAQYKKHCAFSIQPQNYPSAVNYSHFPCSILQPGQVYCHDLTYKFGVQLANYM